MSTKAVPNLLEPVLGDPLLRLCYLLYMAASPCGDVGQLFNHHSACLPEVKNVQAAQLGGPK